MKYLKNNKNFLVYIFPIIVLPFIAYFLYSCHGETENQPPPVTTKLVLTPNPSGTGCIVGIDDDQTIIIDTYKRNDDGTYGKYSTVTKSKGNYSGGSTNIVLPSGSVPAGGVYFDVTIKRNCNECCGSISSTPTKCATQKGKPIWSGKSLITQAGANVPIALNFIKCACECN
jgi:hypothetical protein